MTKYMLAGLSVFLLGALARGTRTILHAPDPNSTDNIITEAEAEAAGNHLSANTTVSVAGSSNRRALGR